MLAEASGEEIGKEEMKVEQLEIQIFDKGEQRNGGARGLGSFFLKIEDINIFVCCSTMRGEN